jgi:predicted transcriptional regulator
MESKILEVIEKSTRYQEGMWVSIPHLRYSIGTRNISEEDLLKHLRNLEEKGKIESKEIIARKKKYLIFKLNYRAREFPVIYVGDESPHFPT